MYQTIIMPGKNYNQVPLKYTDRPSSGEGVSYIQEARIETGSTPRRSTQQQIGTRKAFFEWVSMAMMVMVMMIDTLFVESRLVNFVIAPWSITNAGSQQGPLSLLDGGCKGSQVGQHFEHAWYVLQTISTDSANYSITLPMCSCAGRRAGGCSERTSVRTTRRNMIPSQSTGKCRQIEQSSWGKKHSESLSGCVRWCQFSAG